MKRYLSLLFVAAVLAGCQATPAARDAPGTSTTAKELGSAERPVTVASIRAEYEWLAQRYPGYKRVSQALLSRDERFFDMIEIETADGRKTKVYFDVTGFFGK